MDISFICHASGWCLRSVNRCHRVSRVNTNVSETYVGLGLQVQMPYWVGTKKTTSPTSPSLCMQHIVILGPYCLLHLKHINHILLHSNKPAAFAREAKVKEELTILSLRLMSSSSSFFLWSKWTSIRVWSSSKSFSMRFLWMSWRFKQKWHLDQRTMSACIRSLGLSAPYEQKDKQKTTENWLYWLNFECEYKLILYFIMPKVVSE